MQNVTMKHHLASLIQQIAVIQDHIWRKFEALSQGILSCVHLIMCSKCNLKLQIFLSLLTEVLMNG